MAIENHHNYNVNHLVIFRGHFMSSIQNLAQSYFFPLYGRRKIYFSSINSSTIAGWQVAECWFHHRNHILLISMKHLEKFWREMKYLIKCAHLIHSFISVIIIGNFKVLYYHINWIISQYINVFEKSIILRNNSVFAWLNVISNFEFTACLWFNYRYKKVAFFVSARAGSLQRGICVLIDGQV